MSISTRKKALWKVFTAYIKARDRNICFTCDKYAIGQGMGGGHYLAKAACNPELYFGEHNVHAQCTDCNLKLEGNRHVYRRRLIDKYGIEEVEHMEMHYRDSIVWSEEKYKEKEKYYKEKLKTVENSKGIFDYQDII